jgi:hypothetical protein
MADIRIFELLEKTTLGSSDQFAIYDTLGGLDKKVTAANIAVYVLQNSNQNISIAGPDPNLTLVNSVSLKSGGIKQSEAYTELFSVEKGSTAINGFPLSPAIHVSKFIQFSGGSRPDGLTVIGDNVIYQAGGTIYSLSLLDGSTNTSFSVAGGNTNLLTNDGTNLISYSITTGLIYLHSGVSSTITNSFSAPGAIEGMAFDGSNLLTTDTSGNLYIHDGISASLLDTIVLPNQRRYQTTNNRLGTMAYKGGVLYAAAISGGLVFFDIATEKYLDCFVLMGLHQDTTKRSRLNDDFDFYNGQIVGLYGTVTGTTVEIAIYGV